MKPDGTGKAIPGNGTPARKGILSGGNWIVDHVNIVDVFPAEEKLANIRKQCRGTGGAPYNVLLDLAGLGATFPLAGIGLVGDDDHGNAIIRHGQASGIDMSQVRRTREAPTSFTEVMTVESTGKRTFFHMRGTNRLLDESHFNLEASQARIFHLGYLLLLDALDAAAADGTTGASRLLRQAQHLGFKTSIDVVSEDSDRFPSVVAPALPFVDYLIINEFEASKITGMDAQERGAVSQDRLSAIARAILAKGVREWVIIHFAEGSLARHRDGTEARCGKIMVPPEWIAGTAGAGDAFAAGALFGLHEGLDIPQCLKIATSAAATTLLDATCTGSIRPLADCLKLADQWGFVENARACGPAADATGGLPPPPPTSETMT
jgi:sugar/nucleoside kinase (ribokinase family)